MCKNFSSRFFRCRMAILAIVAILALFCYPIAALASQNDLPWNTALDKLVNAFSGRTALLVSMIGIFFAGGMLIFGGDLGNFGKMVMMIVLVGSMMGALSTVASTFITTEGCLIL
ncbi:MAG: TrbC/VirB2 family protein [Synergistaceae bacterium]|nr:TrbC/VirB2 family protein [Synergistaceae bacterium]